MRRRVWAGIAALGVGAVIALGAAPAWADYGPSTPPPPPSVTVLPQVQVAPEVVVAPQVVTPPTTIPTQVLGETVAAPPAVAGTTLPFTGADIAGLTALALGLIGAGLAIRRAGRRRASL